VALRLGLVEEAETHGLSFFHSYFFWPEQYICYIDDENTKVDDDHL